MEMSSDQNSCPGKAMTRVSCSMATPNGRWLG
jgi:hypothetical protein